MIPFISIFLIVIFIILGTIHFYWAIGGQQGFAEALPVDESGRRIIHPGRISCAIVGLVLYAFGAYYLLSSGWTGIELGRWLKMIPGWIIPLVFLIRAIGDFKYVGFFKSITNSTFSKMDTRLYSPLCLMIAVLGIAIMTLA